MISHLVHRALSAFAPRSFGLDGGAVLGPRDAALLRGLLHYGQRVAQLRHNEGRLNLCLLKFSLLLHAFAIEPLRELPFLDLQNLLPLPLQRDLARLPPVLVVHHQALPAVLVQRALDLRRELRVPLLPVKLDHVTTRWPRRTPRTWYANPSN